MNVRSQISPCIFLKKIKLILNYYLYYIYILIYTSSKGDINMKKLTAMLILILISSSAFPVLIDDIQLKKLDSDRLKLYPVPHDHRNYFFLQSVDNTTQILIGDFSKNDKKKLILITGR